MMLKPVVVTIPHQLGKQKAKARIQESLGELRSLLSRFAVSVEDRWTGDRLDFVVLALSQRITGRIEVLDEAVRVEIDLPVILALLAGKIVSQVRKQGILLLEKK